jgi:hypothetical protein
MAAAAVATDFVDEYIGAVSFSRFSFDRSLGNWIYFPGQIIQIDEGDDSYYDLSYYRIIDINGVTATLIPIEYYGLDTLMHQTLESAESRTDYVQLGESDFYPVNNPTSLNPSTNRNKQDLDLMLAYAPDRSDEIILNYAVEYRGTISEIKGIFRSYENQLYCLLRVGSKYKFWELRTPSGMFGRLVRRYNANERYNSDDVFDEFLSRSDNSGASTDNTDERDNVDDYDPIDEWMSRSDNSDASSEDTARRRPIDSARMRSMRRLADGESLDRRVETLESRMERIERRLGSENPEDDETEVPDPDSLPSLSIRF